MNKTGTTTSSAQRWVLALSSLASFIVVLDMLVVATALPAVQRDLGASLEDLEWTVNAYTLSFAVLLLTGSALGDRYGRRRLFAIGLGLFGVASAACALSTQVGPLIAARVVQGVGAAMIMPVALGVLNGAFPPERRGWATGIYGSVTGLAAVAGPVLGGVVTQNLTWQWIFWLNVPITLVAIPLVLGRIVETRGPGGTLDLPGLALAAGSALGVTWALVRGNAAEWTSAETLSTLVGGILLGGLFIVRELRTPAPMLPMRLFRAPAFSAGNAAVFFINASLTSAIFFTAQFQQVALGHGAVDAGLRLLPWGIAPFLIAPRAGALTDRIGERMLVILGTLLLGVGMGWIALISDPGIGYATTAVAMTVGGLGFSLALPAVTRSVVSRVAPQDIGRASGTFSTLRQFGGAFGVALTGAVFATAGGYATAGLFSDGYVPAMSVSAALAFAATAAGIVLPRHRRLAPATITGRAAPAESTAGRRTP
ncbi:MFS transporter [Micromonospora sp. NPDC049275]|uniref:MFS transporter n=1 Tax=Micromonospora sp. NPDC049275 TaxID=3364268 RepID=UPI00371A7665